MFSYIRLDERIPADHPLRVIRQLVDAALAELSRAFAKLYARDGRPSIPPERLLRALLLQAFYTVRSELQLMEQLNYNLLFRWFVGFRPRANCRRHDHRRKRHRIHAGLAPSPPCEQLAAGFDQFIDVRCGLSLCPHAEFAGF